MPPEDGTVTRGMDTGLFEFRHSVTLRVRLHETLRVLGSSAAQTCLDIGSPNGALSGLLRKQGGKWPRCHLPTQAVL